LFRVHVQTMLRCQAMLWKECRRSHYPD
jgi:hypothetical protein